VSTPPPLDDERRGDHDRKYRITIFNKKYEPRFSSLLVEAGEAPYSRTGRNNKYAIASLDSIYTIGSLSTTRFVCFESNSI
jgi:hypothetical protein